MALKQFRTAVADAAGRVVTGRKKQNETFLFCCFVFPVTWDSSELTQRVTSGKHWNSVSFQSWSFLIFLFHFVLMSLPSF